MSTPAHQPEDPPADSGPGPEPADSAAHTTATPTDTTAAESGETPRPGSDQDPRGPQGPGDHGQQTEASGTAVPQEPVSEAARPRRPAHEAGDSAEALSGEHLSVYLRQSSHSPAVYGGSHNAAIAVNLGGEQPVEFQLIPLDAVDLARRDRLYQRLPHHSEMAGGLAVNHLIVLFGARGSGVDTTARVLLGHACGDSGRVGVLHATGTKPAQALAEQADRYLSRGHGVLLDLGTERPGPEVLKRLGMQAVRRKAFVVLIVEGTGTDLGTLQPYAFAHPRPDLKNILLVHLAEALDQHRARHQGQPDACSAHDVREFTRRVSEDARLDRELGGTLPVRDAVSLAGTLATYLHLPPEELGRAFGVWRDRLRTAARVFLDLTNPAPDPAPDPYERPMRIAYVLCENMPQSDFIRVGTLLCDEVQRTENRETAPLRPVFELDLDQLVPPGMGIAAASETGAADNPRRIRLAEPELMPTVIEVIWHGLGWLRAPLLRWLHRLAHDQLERVRSRAAFIAGHLLRHDFDSVYRDLVRNWARGESVRERQYAALALAVAAETGDPWLTARIDRQVAAWAGSPVTRLQDSAARAYGTPVGTRDVRATLTALQKLGGRPGLSGYASVAYAMSALFLTGGGTEPVTEALGRWIRSDNDHLRRHALRVLLVVGPLAVGPELPYRPKLAHGALDDPAGAQTLLLLWRDALIDPVHSGQTWELLGHWLLAADEDKELGEFLDEFVPRVCSDAHRRRRALFNLGRWARRYPDARSLSRVLRALRER
ncbi:hypothetical protein [Streptomyces sediminimaris]|uniref:hypothetical protein n=1 Tax=Streptomyces sediminimaris TaxID=3383721 RepID=UPI00399AFBBD